MIPWCYFTSLSSHTHNTRHPQPSMPYLSSIIVASNRFHSIQFAIQWKLSFYRQPIPFFLLLLYSPFNSQWLHAVFDAVCWMWMYLLCWNSFHSVFLFPSRTCWSFFCGLRLTIDFWHAHILSQTDVYFWDTAYVEGFIGIIGKVLLVGNRSFWGILEWIIEQIKVFIEVCIIWIVLI